MPNPCDRNHIVPPPGIAEWRDGQAEIVAEIIDGFAQGFRAVLLDTPTGTGKSVMVAGAAYALGGRCIYTSKTKDLQADIEKKIRGAVRLVGKANYPAVNDRTLRCDDCRDRSLCPDPRDNHGCERCPYRLAKMRALAAPMPVLNFPYFVLEANHVGGFSNWDLIVLDEAEEVEKAIRGAATVAISGARIKQLRIDPPRAGAGTGDVLRWVEVVLTPKLDDSIEACKFTLETIPPAGRQAIAVGRDLRRFERLRQTIGFQVEAGGDNLVGHVVPADRSDAGTVVLEPILAAPYAHQLLWRHANRFLLASGSFIDTDRVMGELGWTEPSAVVSRPSPFPAERRPILWLPIGSMANSAKTVTMPKAVAGIRGILRTHPAERGVIHGVAYGRCREIAEALGDPRVILATRRAEVSPDEDGARPDVELERYKATPGAVLITPRHERGVSLDDDLCRFMILVKSPLAGIKEPRVIARMGLDGGQWWYGCLEPARRLLQMSGRGNRNAGDYCVVYVLDADIGKILASGVMPGWWMDAVVR